VWSLWEQESHAGILILATKMHYLDGCLFIDATLYATSHYITNHPCLDSQTVYGCAALTLLVPVFFHWYAPREDEEDSKAWASSGLSWQAKIQLIAFCAFEVCFLHSSSEQMPRNLE
jgi:hypothetical protein